jgi:hypothetical protein
MQREYKSITIAKYNQLTKATIAKHGSKIIVARNAGTGLNED